MPHAGPQVEAEASEPAAREPESVAAAAWAPARAGRGLTPQAMLALQRSVGNRAAGQVLRARMLQRQMPPVELPIEPPFEPAPWGGWGEMPEIGEPEIDIDPLPNIEPAPDIEPMPDIAPEPTPTPDPMPVPEPMPTPDPMPVPEPSPGPIPSPDFGPQPQPQPDEEQEKDKDPCASGRLPTTKVVFTPGPLGQAGSARASPLTKCPPQGLRGSMGKESTYPDQFKCIRSGLKKGERLQWFPCHLLHGATRRTGSRTMHGPGDDRRNIIIGRNDLNTSMFFGVEWGALVRIWDLNQTLWYEAKVDSYHPGAEFFAKSITVTYGLYNIATKSEGPQIFKGTFKSDVPAPNCPPTKLPPSGSGTVPGVPSAPGQPKPAPAATPPADWTSTMKICQRILKTRAFPVKNGGLKVTLRAGWSPTGACAPSEYRVSLEQKGMVWDSEISTSKVPAGKAVSLTWRRLEADDYYLIVSVPPDHDSTCCLTGDISARTFDAPRVRHKPGEPWA